MRTVELWRYPVKSMQGESLTRSDVGPVGLEGDRARAVRDTETGIVLTGRRDPQMLFASGVADAGGATVRLPDGRITADDAVLSDWIGRPVALVAPRGVPSTYEIAVDPEDDDSEIVSWQGPSDTFHDSGRTQISIIATGDLGSWPTRRFRPNVVVEAETADVLVGQRIRLGTAELEVVKQIDRCVMVTRPQPDGIERDLDVLRTIRRDREMFLGVGALVRTPGSVAVGDAIEVLGTSG